MIYQLTNDELAAVRELYDRMIAAGPDHFDMATFGSYVDPDGGDDTTYPGWWTNRQSLPFSSVVPGFEQGPQLDTLCGYTACLAGHAALAGLGNSTLNIAETLGMIQLRYIPRPDDDRHPGWAATDRWFYHDEWPQWARDLTDRAIIQVIDELEADGVYDGAARRTAQWRVVTGVMHDLIHGVRRNWFDDDLAAVHTADLTDTHTQED